MNLIFTKNNSVNFHFERMINAFEIELRSYMHMYASPVLHQCHSYSRSSNCSLQLLYCLESNYGPGVYFFSATFHPGH